MTTAATSAALAALRAAQPRPVANRGELEALRDDATVGAHRTTVALAGRPGSLRGLAALARAQVMCCLPHADRPVYTHGREAPRG